MLESLLPPGEGDRLRAVRDLDILDTPAEAAYDDIARLAAHIAGTPISLVSIMDADRQWFKARVGMALAQTPRDIAFCRYTMSGRDLLVVPDATRDERFADNPLVTSGPQFRFYAGVPLVMPEGPAVGTLCVLDVVPGQLSVEQGEALRALARQVVTQLQLRRAARALKEGERFVQSALDALASRVAILDGDGTILAVNLAWRRFADADASRGSAAGSAAGTAVGENYLAAGADTSAAPYADESAAAVAGIREVLTGVRDTFATEYPCRSPTGPRWFSLQASRFASDGPLRLVVSHDDVTERRLAVDRLLHTSTHDALTDLPNRMHFAERVERAIALAQRGDYSFAVLFLDLDRFKIVNDSLGHGAGDAMLTTTAARLRATLRPADVVDVVRRAGASDRTADHDTVARMGGDEFTILLENLRSPEDAARVAERVRQAIAEPMAYEGHELITTASIGIVACGGATGPKYGTAKHLLRDADAAMYKAKATGRDRFAIFDHAMHVEAVTRMQLEADLRRAIDRGELELHYQPILSLARPGIVGFEALVRWRREGQLVSPGAFIPVAEDTRLILPIGEWVLRRACQQLADWRASGGPMADVYVTVNVSRHQLEDPSLPDAVARILRETGAPAAALGLEITESSIMLDPAGAEQTLEQIKRQTGVRVLMDDFGTGHSALGCLRRFPIDVLKIDRAFVSNLMVDRRDKAVMRTIITLAHDLGMSVVAEGIESSEQAEFLVAAGCDRSQGFLFSRPLEAAAAERFVRQGVSLIVQPAV